jgi:hypothetical protein
MAKIDVTKIEGYESMSAEEKLTALEQYEFDLPSATNEDKLKQALSKANAEAASWKKQYKEKLTEAERAEADRAEAEKAMRDELDTLRREQTVSKLEAQYLAAGYSPELASASAQAQADGDTATVLANQLAFIEATKKDLEARALGNQPGLSVGKPPEAKSDEEKIVDLAMKYAGLT